MIRHADGSVTMTYKIDFTRGPRGWRQTTPVETPTPALRPAIDPSRVPKLTRLLVLGHHFNRLVRDGVVKDFIDICRLTGLSKSRVTQIVNLTLLSPAIQAEILSRREGDTGTTRLHERWLRPIVDASSWDAQTRRFSALRS